MKRKGCSHGKTFDERCIDCELVLAREGLRWSQEGVERYTQQIARLETEKRVIMRSDVQVSYEMRRVIKIIGQNGNV